MGCNPSPLISGLNKYQAPCRIGNWYEEMCISNLEVEKFKKKRDNRQLMVEKAHNMFGKLLKEVALTPAKESVYFNSIIQITPFKMMLSDLDTTQITPALSIIVNEKFVIRNDTLGEDCEVVVAHSSVPRVRTCFRIVSCDSTEDADNNLMFGGKFRIQLLDSNEDPLYLYSAPKRSNLSMAISSSNTSKVRGQDTLPLGVVKGSNCGPDCDVPLAFTYWFCKNVDPLMRYNEAAVPNNKPIVIVHMATNQNLAVENTYIETLFGREYMACVQNYRNIFKRETWKNLWVLKNNRY